jgi:hypothetical protein
MFWDFRSFLCTWFKVTFFPWRFYSWKTDMSSEKMVRSFW